MAMGEETGDQEEGSEEEEEILDLDLEEEDSGVEEGVEVIRNLSHWKWLKKR